MPIQFTLRYKDRASSLIDVSGERAWVPLMGRMLAEPIFSKGARLPYGLDMGFRPRTIEMYLDADGELKPNRGGDVGVRLDGNDPAYNLDRLQYRVIAPDGLTDAEGNEVDWPVVHFDAPTDDRIVYLSKELPRPGQKFGRGRPGFGIRGLDVTDGMLIITTEDERELAAVEIPESNSLAAAYTMTFGR